MTHSVTIRFDDHHVRVHADDKSVIGRVARSFRNMLAPNSSEHKDQDDTNMLEVRNGEQAHSLWRDDSLVFSDRELRRVQRALRHEIISCFVRARPDLLWLHAGAAVNNGKAVLFIGSYGRGKSTLVTELCKQGWQYASDDIVPITFASGYILPFPVTPIVRQHIGKELPDERISELSKSRVRLPTSLYYRKPVAIGAIVFPRYRAGTGTKVEFCSPAAAALEIIRHGINRDANEPGAVELSTRLVSNLPVIHLPFSDAAAAADLIMTRLSLTAFRSRGRRPSKPRSSKKSASRI